MTAYVEQLRRSKIRVNLIQGSLQVGRLLLSNDQARLSSDSHECKHADLLFPWLVIDDLPRQAVIGLRPGQPGVMRLTSTSRKMTLATWRLSLSNTRSKWVEPFLARVSRRPSYWPKCRLRSAGSSGYSPFVY